MIKEVLLDVWREVSKHLEIRESTGTIADMLARHWPAELLIVRRIDHVQGTIETVAVGGPVGRTRIELPRAAEAGRSVDSTSRLKRFVALAKAGEVLEVKHNARRSDEVDWLVPAEIRGPALVGALQTQGKPSGVLVLVGPPRDEFRAEHRALFDALLEPFSAALENDRRLHELSTLREAAEADRRSLLNRPVKEKSAESIVGANGGLRHVMQRVQLVSQSDVPVLILGETGTGKEVISRAIHNRSPRVSGPFIRVNCGAIPPELLDSQLFGHEKGSFTGASETRQGWFERADGGTLFLDEIGELSKAAQVRLLRVLQDHQFERVGGQVAIRVDVRIIAATHRDLSTMVKAGTFREDLWYRVNVFPILLPRLRERTDDIPELACHFAQRAAQRFGLPYVEPNATDLLTLMNYSWPGNIRELGAVLDRAAILGNGTTLEVAAALGLSRPLPPPSNDPTYYEVIPEAIQLSPTRDTMPAGPITTLDDAMKQHIERALGATRGKIEGPQGAAALLGINPHTLRARMRKLEIDWSRFRPE